MQFAASLLFGALALAALSPGRPAPPFLLEDAEGNEVTLSTYAGKPLVMNVFASWCPPCRQELPGIIAAAKAGKGRVTFVGVDEQEAVQMGKAFARQMKIPYRVVFDHGQFAASYGAQSLPETVFIDARGRVAAIVHGAIGAADLARNLAKIAQ